MVITTIRLYVQRHGQATHNAADETAKRMGIADSGIGRLPEFYDPPLTELGIQQVTKCSIPEAILMSDFEKTAEFWVSPLRRTLQTACLGLPKVREWRVVELIREIAGSKNCDARRRRSEIKEWASKEFPSVQNWDFDDVHTEDDEMHTKRREVGADLWRRALQALRLAAQRSQQYGKSCYVWVSHSAFLAALLSLLDIYVPEQRWLENGEWREYVVPVQALQSHLEHRLAGYPSREIIKLQSHKHANALKPFRLKDEHKSKLRNERTFIYTTEMISALCFNTTIHSKEVAVLIYPIAQTRTPSKARSVLVNRLKEFWKIEPDQSPTPFQPKEALEVPEYAKLVTQKSLIDISRYITLVPKEDDEGFQTVSFEKLGLYMGADLVVCCVPLEEHTFVNGYEDLPSYLSLDALEELLHISNVFDIQIRSNSVNIIIPHDI